MDGGRLMVYLPDEVKHKPLTAEEVREKVAAYLKLIDDAHEKTKDSKLVFKTVNESIEKLRELSAEYNIPITIPVQRKEKINE